MYRMSGTWDVLKLSGWLNAYAYCRVQRQAWHEVDAVGQETGGRGGGGLSDVQREPDW